MLFHLSAFGWSPCAVDDGVCAAKQAGTVSPKKTVSTAITEHLDISKIPPSATIPIFRIYQRLEREQSNPIVATWNGDFAFQPHSHFQIFPRKPSHKFVLWVVASATTLVQQLGSALQAAEKLKALSFRTKRGISPSFVFLLLNRREIPRFARNDRIRPYFRSLFTR
jgi:hypothetical protein